MRKEITHAFAVHSQELQALERSRHVGLEHDISVTRALEFVKRNQNPDGSWGLGTMIGTNLALLSVGIWSPDNRTWETAGTHVGGVELAFAWLDKAQRRNSWENNIWDTAATLQAAAYLDELARPSMQRGLKWLISNKDTGWGLDAGLPPHYAAQALLAFIRCDAPRESVDDVRKLLLEAVRTDLPRITNSLYIAGQVLEALVLAGENPLRDDLAPLLRSVRAELLRCEVSISNFLDICAGLKGLGAALGGVDVNDPAINRTLTRMFNPNRLRGDGSWYRDVTLSGWALVALEEVRQVKRIEAYPHELRGLSHRLESSVAKATDRELQSRVVLASCGLAGGLAISALLLLLWTTVIGEVPKFPNTDLAFFLAPAFLAVGGVCARLVWQRLR